MVRSGSMRWFSLFVGLVLTLLPAVALAQADQALQLFKEGREAMDSKDYNVACAKFEESHALDPRVGTLLNLGLCEESRGRLVRALEVWRMAAELGARLDDPRKAEAASKAEALGARIPKLTLVMPADAPSGAVVRVELGTAPARALTRDELDKPVPVDPGKVTITVEVNGKRSTKVVELAEGASEEVLLEVPSSDGTSTDPDPGAGAGGGGVDGLMIAGFVAGGVGIVGMVVGGVFGGIAKSKDDESKALAPPDGCDESYNCGAAGLALNDDAIQAATVSTALFIAGGVLTAVGVTLVVVSLTTSEEPAASALELKLDVSPTGASATLRW